MPAKSQAQRAALNARFGHAWVKKHHFDNTGPLPAHVPNRKKKKGKTSRADARKRGDQLASIIREAK